MGYNMFKQNPQMFYKAAEYIKPPSRMSLSEAKSILGFDAANVNIKDLNVRYKKLLEANDPTVGGSPYLREKVEVAKKVLEESQKKKSGL